MLAAAVSRLWPEAKFARCGVAAVPFASYFCDVDLQRPLVPHDLWKLSETMAEIVREDVPLERKTLPRRGAMELFEKRHQSLLVERLEESEEEFVHVCQCGDFVGLSEADEAPSSGACRFFYLLEEVREVFWTGRSRLPLQRLQGVAWPSPAELARDRARLERACERDHRWIGRSLRLFEPSSEVRGDFVWPPRGTTLRNILLERTRELLRREAFQEVRTPPLAVGPPHAAVYAAELRGEEQLPMRFFEFLRGERRESVSSSEGLRHSRSFTADRQTVFASLQQAGSEAIRLAELVARPYAAFQIALRARVTPRPGGQVQLGLERLLEERGFECSVGGGHAAFPGPRIDFVAENAFGRFEHPSGYVQVDERLAERRQLRYLRNGKPTGIPAVLHGALFASLESFLASVLEKTGGLLPLWLAPIQCRVISVCRDCNDYAREIRDKLSEGGFRCELDARFNKIQTKLRDAAHLKIPCVLVAGERERRNGTAHLRPRDIFDEARTVKIDELLENLQEEIEDSRVF